MTLIFKKNQLAICHQCGIEFPMKSATQKFCNRKCFKKNYYRRSNENGKKNYPIFNCDNCGKKTQLDFFPIRSGKRWRSFKCPKCSCFNFPPSEKLKNPCYQCGMREIGELKKMKLCNFCYNLNYKIAQKKQTTKDN